jgi:hypothetical protein
VLQKRQHLLAANRYRAFNTTMRELSKILLGLILLIHLSCGQRQFDENTMTKFKDFKLKEKFIKEDNLFYPGINDLVLKPILTQKINLLADDFEKLSRKGGATDKDYQNVIKIGLSRFNTIYIDSEEQERICYYVEELMDIVGLESSDGQLNNFRYGFDQIKK